MSEQKPWYDLMGPLIDTVDRTSKPRKSGLTMVIDVGEPLELTQGIIESCGDLIDHWKLSFGTSAFVGDKELREKLAAINSAGILTYPGGTLLEIAATQNGAAPCVSYIKEVGFTAVEVSDGSLYVPLELREELIKLSRDAGLRVVSEVGSKNPQLQPSAKELAQLTKMDMDWGSEYVVVEAREGGTNIGIYDVNGRVESEFVDELIEDLGEERASQLIWEAPLKDQQVYHIRRFGPNVNLGNIPLNRVLALEAMRCGLRYDTLDMLIEAMVEEGRWKEETNRRRMPASTHRVVRTKSKE